MQYNVHAVHAYVIDNTQQLHRKCFTGTEVRRKYHDNGRLVLRPGGKEKELTPDRSWFFLFPSWPEYESTVVMISTYQVTQNIYNMKKVLQLVLMAAIFLSVLYSWRCFSHPNGHAESLIQSVGLVLPLHSHGKPHPNKTLSPALELTNPIY